MTRLNGSIENKDLDELDEFDPLPRKIRNAQDDSYREPNHDPSDPEDDDGDPDDGYEPRG